MLVRLRPNVSHLLLVAVATTCVVWGLALILRNNMFGIVAVVGASPLLALFGFPIVVSTIFRVPILAVTEIGIRLPLMGVQMTWSEIAYINLAHRHLGKTSNPVLLIVPVDGYRVVAKARPGTPIFIRGESLDHSLDDIAATIRRYQSAQPSKQQEADRQQVATSALNAD